MKQLFNNPPTVEGKPAIQSVVVFTPSRDDWADVPGACLRDYSPANLALLMKYQSQMKGKACHMVIILDDLLARIDFGSKLTPDTGITIFLLSWLLKTLVKTFIR